MNKQEVKYYPSLPQAINLIVLYTFIQSLIDFPLALLDYQNGSDWLSKAWIKLPVFFGSTIFILYLGYRFTQDKITEVFPLKKFHIGLVPVLLIILVSLQFFMNEISLQVDKILPPPAWFLELFSRIFESDLGIWGGLIKVVILAPVVEESIFRGVIMYGFLRNYKAFWAILFSALLFALFHLNPWQLGPTFLLGLLLGVVRYRTGSLAACIFTHALHNGMVFFTVLHPEWIQQFGIQQNGLQMNYIIHSGILIAGFFILNYSGLQKLLFHSSTNESKSLK